MSIWEPIAKNEQLPLPSKIEPDEKNEWVEFAKRLVDCQRHEDGLLNTRLQGFVVATALLMAAVSQFRDDKFMPIATVICLAGLVLSAAAFRVLRRTARTIEWYLDALVRLDPLLFSTESQRLYEARRNSLGELHTTGAKRAHYPVNALLGAWLPLMVSFIWFVVLLALGWVHRRWLFS